MNRDTFLNLPQLEGGVPRHQELRKDGKLFERRVSLEEVFTQRLARTSVVFSHRWFEPTHPDPQNVKLLKAQEFVHAHPAVDAVWMDWLSVPQSHGGPPRTKDEEDYFTSTLYNINMLYLGLQVVVLYDNQYNGRFWPCVECWSSYQVATPEGLKAEESDLRRRTVFVCVAASVGTEAQAQSFMEKQWRRVTCDQAVERLMGPDLLVTNRKDKEVQVQVLKNLNKQTAKFVTTFFATLSGLPLPTALDKFFASGPLRDSAGDDVLGTLLGRVSFDEFSALGTLKDSALELVAERHRGHPRVSSSTREELEAFFRVAFAGPSAENSNTLFPVFDETLKVKHGGSVLSVCALPDGRLLTGSDDNFARVFSDTGAELFKMQHGGWVLSVCALPDGRLLTGSADNFARVFSDTTLRGR